MTRRRLTLGALVLLLAAAGIVAYLLWPASPSQSAITREAAAQVRVGMTLAEVEAIMGGPTRDDSTGPVIALGPSVEVLDALLVPWPGHASCRDIVDYTVWLSDTFSMTVWFNESGTVACKTTAEVRRSTWFEMKVRPWLPR